jgi:hypothetical protein
VSGDEHRIYGELALWWPLISPPADDAEEAAFSGWHGEDGRGVRYLEWSRDPDPSDHCPPSAG